MQKLRLAYLVLVALLGSCGAANRQAQSVEEPLERAKHKMLAERFIQQAAMGNVDGLLESLAQVTLNTNDKTALEEYLRDQIAPFFHGYSRLHWQGQHLTVKDGQGNEGVQYYEFVEVKGGEVRPFVITLFPEENTFRVTSIVVGECFRGYHLACP